MSIIKAIRNQLGLSVTPANNFTLTAEADNGTMKLARGNAGTTTQDLITVSANNVITGGNEAVLVGNGPAFRVVRNATQSVTADTWNKINFNTKTFDTANCFDLTNDRFIPNIPGYYQISGTVYATGDNVYGGIFLNGVFYQYGCYSSISIVDTIVYLNGSTDYIELFIYPESAVTAINDPTLTHLTGALVRAG